MKTIFAKVTRPLLLVFLLLSQMSFAQWTVESNSGENPRWGTAAAVLGDTAYRICGSAAGFDYNHGFQKYDPVKGWVALANYPGSGGEGPCGFALNGKLYFGMGNISGGSMFKDFWKFDPVLQTWTKAADFPGAGRSYATAFTIGSYAYVGLGWSYSLGTTFKDVYRYDDGADSWTKMDDFPGGIRMKAASFVIGDTAYAGLGNNGASCYRDFYSFNPNRGSGSQWKSATSFPSKSRTWPSTFAFCNKGFIALGEDSNNVSLNEVWMYDPANGVGGKWMRFPDFNGLNRFGAQGFAIGNTAYIAGGGAATGVVFAYSDFWSYSPDLLSVSPNATICNGATVTLSATGNSVYQWTPASSLSDSITTGIYPIPSDKKQTTAKPTAPTTYTVTEAVCGAQQVISIKVNPVPSLTVTPTSASICSGKTTDLNVSGASTYLWSPSTGLSSSTGNSVVANPTATTTYTITGADSAGCSGSGSVVIVVNFPSGVSAGPDFSMYFGQSKPINCLAKGTYNWSPSTGLSCADCADPIVDPQVSTTYFVTVTDSNGCVSSDTLAVDVLYNDPFVPTAFSPNGDQTNDLLFVRGDLFKNLEFVIFNRWGEKVFETQTTSNGWDGTYRGKKLDPGVFVYSLKGTTYTDKQIDKKGNITLVR